MAGSKRCRRSTGKREDITRRERDDAERDERGSMKRDERMREISTAVRAALAVWEIVWTLVREHVLHGPGSGRLL